MEVPVNFDIGNSSGTEPNTLKNTSEKRPSSNQSTLSYADLNCEQPLAGLGLQQLEKRTELSCKKELERGKRHIAFSACSCRPEPQQQPAVYRVAGAWQAAAVSAPLPFATEENLSKVCNVDGPWSGGGIGQAAAFAVVLVCRHENNWKARTTRTTTTVQGCRSRGAWPTRF